MQNVLKCRKCLGRGKVPNPAWLRQERRRRGLTLREVAKAMGASLPYVSDLERGRSLGRALFRLEAAIERLNGGNGGKRKAG